MPRIQMSTIHEFFAAARESVPEPPVWSGSCTSNTTGDPDEPEPDQVHRRAEILLREVRDLATAATFNRDAEYPGEELRACGANCSSCSSMTPLGNIDRVGP